MQISFLLRLVIPLICAILFIKTAQPQTVSTDTFFTEEKLKEVVYEIADDSLQGRFTNSPGCEQAAIIIARRMQVAGLRKVKGMNGYFFDLDSSFAYVRNVMGALPGNEKSDELIIISAHYDHIGTIGNKNENPAKNQIYNGANDDASGVAVMLSLAAYFAASPVQRTLLFIAFSGEEIGFIGSAGASQAFIPTQIIAQINLEMLGRAGFYKKPFITGHNYSNLRSLLNQALRDTLGLDDYFEKDTPAGTLFQRSDNYPFATLGVPAHTIMLTTDFDKYYHTLNDDPNTLDYKTMALIAKKVAFSIEPLVQGKITPQRIYPRKIPQRQLPFNTNSNSFQKKRAQ